MLAVRIDRLVARHGLARAAAIARTRKSYAESAVSPTRGASAGQGWEGRLSVRALVRAGRDRPTGVPPACAFSLMGGVLSSMKERAVSMGGHGPRMVVCTNLSGPTGFGPRAGFESPLVGALERIDARARSGSRAAREGPDAASREAAALDGAPGRDGTPQRPRRTGRFSRIRIRAKSPTRPGMWSVRRDRSATPFARLQLLLRLPRRHKPGATCGEIAVRFGYVLSRILMRLSARRHIPLVASYPCSAATSRLTGGRDDDQTRSDDRP